MTTEIFDNFTGRSFSDYDLLDELSAKYSLDRRIAHEGIHAFLSQIIDIDGQDKVILSMRASQPELLEYNPTDLDVRYWWTISDEVAEAIRDSFAAVYGQDNAE